MILADFNAMQNEPKLSAAGDRSVAAGGEPPVAPALPASPAAAGPGAAAELGGPPGPEPTRFGDWEKNGRCIDF